MRLRLVLLLPAALLLASLAAAREPAVVLISLDGTSARMLDDGLLPRLAELAERGGRADRLVPSFPTNTFPNHVTLVTGVAPERHGIVNNSFVDPERGRFHYGSDPTWIEVEPLWSLLAAHHIGSASYHWVGSEGTWRTGRGPLEWVRFDSSVPEAKKVDRILSWLERPDGPNRPRLVTSWFHGADAAAHRHGLGSGQVIRTLARQDRELARLARGLEAKGLLASTTVLVVSDHGMARVEHEVDLAAALRRAHVPAEVLGGGGVALVVVHGSAARRRRVIEVARGLGLQAFEREHPPAGLRVDNPRFGDVIVLAPLGTAIVRHRGVARLAAWFGRPTLRAAHGYPPDAPPMAAILVAFGRSVPHRARLGVVRAVDVAPTILALLGVSVPAWMEGRPIPALVGHSAGKARKREVTQ